MAFTGTPVIEFVTQSLCRITGVSLAAGASGTIGLFPKTVAPGVRLPEQFQPAVYDLLAGADPVSLQASISCSVNYQGPVNTDTPVTVNKSGTTPEDFQITLENEDDGEGASTGDLEIYVRFQ